MDINFVLDVIMVLTISVFIYSLVEGSRNIKKTVKSIENELEESKRIKLYEVSFLGRSYIFLCGFMFLLAILQGYKNRIDSKTFQEKTKKIIDYIDSIEPKKAP